MITAAAAVERDLVDDADFDLWDEVMPAPPPPPPRVLPPPIFEELPIRPPAVHAGFDVGARHFPGAVVSIHPYEAGKGPPPGMPMARGRIRLRSARLWDLHKQLVMAEFDRPAGSLELNARGTFTVDSATRFQAKYLTAAEKRDIVQTLGRELQAWEALDSWGRIPVHVEPQMDQLERVAFMYAIAQCIPCAIAARDKGNGYGVPYRYTDLRAKKAGLARPRKRKRTAADEVEVEDVEEPAKKKRRLRKKAVATKADKEQEAVPETYDDRKDINIGLVKTRLRADEDWDGLRFITRLEEINADRPKKQWLGVRDICDAIAIATERLDRGWD